MNKATAEISHHFAEVEGLKLHYLRAGQGSPPIVLLHGGGSDYSELSWKEVLPQLAQHTTCIAPDFPGYGHSSKVTPDDPIPFFAGILEKFIATLGLEKPILAGLSMGGGVALQMALNAPQNYSGLILIASYGLGGAYPVAGLFWLLSRILQVPSHYRHVLEKQPLLLKSGLKNLIYDHRKITESLIEDVLKAMALASQSQAWKKFIEREILPGGFRTDFTEQLPSLTLPVLIVHGQNDRLIPPQWARRAHRLMPQSRLVMFPRCGHWIPREKPNELVREIISFLKGK